MKRYLLLFLTVGARFAVAGELIASCELGGSVARRVDVVRDSRIADTYVYYLRQHGQQKPFFGDKNSSRGEAVQVACVGTRARALVATGEFTANALQGFVLSMSPKLGKVERLDFAGKSRPEWLYLTPSETIVVVATHGYGETNKKYVAYRHAFGSVSEAKAEALDELPVSSAAEVIKLVNNK